jgi:hypothetical protein
VSLQKPKCRKSLVNKKERERKMYIFNVKGNMTINRGASDTEEPRDSDKGREC